MSPFFGTHCSMKSTPECTALIGKVQKYLFPTSDGSSLNRPLSKSEPSPLTDQYRYVIVSRCISWWLRRVPWRALSRWQRWVRTGASPSAVRCRLATDVEQSSWLASSSLPSGRWPLPLYSPSPSTPSSYRAAVVPGKLTSDSSHTGFCRFYVALVIISAQYNDSNEQQLHLHRSGLLLHRLHRPHSLCIQHKSFLPRCMECSRGIAMGFLSVRPSICPSVRLSVRLSVCQTCALWQNGRKLCLDFYIIWKNIYPSFQRRRMVGGGRPLIPEILGQPARVGAKSPILNR